MSALFKKIGISSQRGPADSQQRRQVHCNYANNYYGDQVCVEVKPSKPRINIHVGVQL